MNKAAVFLILFLIFAGLVWGQKAPGFYWIGMSGDSWDDNDKWMDENDDPVSYYPGENALDDIVFIQNSTGSIQYSDSSHLTIKELTIENSNITIDVISAVKLTIDEFTINNGSDVTIESDDEVEVTGTLANAGIFTFNGVKLSADTLTNNGTLNFGGTDLSVVNTLTNSGTLNFNGGDLSVVNTLTNSGILDLGSADLSADTLNNTGTIKLQGSQSVNINVPPVIMGGTIHYQGDTSLPWPFNYSYTNLHIDSSLTMSAAGDLDIQGIAFFGSDITAASLTVVGSSTINANITTTGDQTYTGAVTLSSSGKRIIISHNGNIEFKSTLDSADIIELAATDGNITITGKTTAYQLIAIADGAVTVDEIEIDSSNTGSEGTGAAIYIEANIFAVTTTTPDTIIPGGSTGQLCLMLATIGWADNDNVVEGGRWHQHNNANLSGKHLVYGDGPLPPDLNPYVDNFNRIYNNSSIKTMFSLDPGYNIYIYGAFSDNTSGLTFKTGAGGFIEISGTNTFERLTLESGDGDVRLVDANIIITDSFELANNEKLTLDSTLGANSIEASEITLNDISAKNGEDLSLNAASGDINLKGAVGTSSDPIGNITINSAGTVSFLGNLFANSIDVTGNDAINIGADITTADTQTYTGAVMLEGTGALITLIGANVTLGTIDGNGKSLTITGSGVFNGGIDIEDLSVTEDFSLVSGTLSAASVDVTGTSNIAGNITTAGDQTYTGEVTLGGDITLTSTAGSVMLGVITGDGNSLTIDGNGVLNGGGDIEDLSVTKDFSLASGTLSAATVDVSGTSNIAGNITTAGDQTYIGEVTLGDDITLTSTAGSVMLGHITGDGNSLTIDGNGVLNGGSGIEDLSITKDFSLANSTLDAATINITGTSTIAENITTAGNQNYGNGTVTLTGTRTLTSAGGSITANGIVNGANLTVESSQGISLAGANTLSGIITLNNTQTGIVPSGDIAFTNTSASITLTAENKSGDGTITVMQTGDLSITSLQTTGTNDTISIEVAGEITQTGAIITNSLTVEAGTGIALDLTNEVTESVELTSALGNIEFVNDCGSAGDLNVTVLANSGNVKITETNGGLIINGIIAAGKNITLEAAGSVTQTATKKITAAALIVKAETFITLNEDNNVLNVNITSNAATAANGNITYNSDAGEGNTLKMTVDTLGDISVTEKSGGLEVEEITKGHNINLKADTDIKTEGITVSGFIKMEAGGNITITGKTTAYQLVVIADGIVKVDAIEIDSSNTGNEGAAAAIYIVADDFIITTTAPGSIVPGGKPAVGLWGQLCLNLINKWEDTNGVIDGPEDRPFGTITGARWHQHYIDLSGMHLIYGDGSTPPNYIPTEYFIITNNNSMTKFVLDSGFNIYIYNAEITNENNTGLTFETSGSGFIKLMGTNKFTNLALKTESGDINLEGIDETLNTLSYITAETSTGKININQDIDTTGMQKYTGEVTLGDNVTLTSPSVTESITLGHITGDGKSLTITGNGVLNGGSGIENLSVSGAAITINQSITTTGTQEYTGEVTLGGSDTLITLEGTTVMLGHITGGGKSLTVTGDGVLNGGSDINILSVSGNAVINEDIAATGTQTYSGTVTLGGLNTLITLEGTTVTLEKAIIGSGKSLTIDGNGVLNGGSGIEDLSVTEDFNLVSGTLSAVTIDVTGTSAITENITTTGDQTYTGEVTLGIDLTLTSTAGSVTLGVIIGDGKSLIIEGNGVLNGGNGIENLSVTKDFSLISGTLNAATIDVTGTSNIDGDITTAGSQTYTGVAILSGSGKRTLKSDNDSIVFNSTINSTNAIELLAENGNIAITGKTTAYQLIAKASITKDFYVSVNAVEINSSNTGNEKENAAIYIIADYFTVTTIAPNSIIPGGRPSAGQWGQLCLELNRKWEDSNGVVDGPEDKPFGTVHGARWHQHFMVIGKILYSFTEDSNGNGKLDRIRVQTNKELLGNFTDFDVSVAGYKVSKFDFVKDNEDSFYIYLEEKTEFDGDKTPQWSITKNTSLIDVTGNPMLDNIDITDNTDKKIYIDTIPPRIVYTLTLPGHPQTYVQISEPVQTSGGDISAGDISFDGNSAASVTKIDLGYLFDYSTSYKAEDLAKLTDIDSVTAGVGYFQMNDIFDKGLAPELSVIDSSYPPKYPMDWSYTAYTDSNGLVPPNELISVMAKDSGSARRVTDVLVSLSPNNYFVWPVWAKPSADNNSIMEFDGSKYLEKASIEKSGIEMQARTNNNLTITPQLFWTMTDIPANMRNPKETSDAKKTGGLWLPDLLTNPLYCYVPLLNGINQTPPAANSSSPLFNYDIAANDLANSGAKFEFVFRMSNSDMFIARFDAPQGAIPNNWYTLVRPFSFNIQSIRYQRGGVTILNNVINSDNKETVYIRYDLPRAGRVTVQIYTLDGTLVKSIRRNENRESGAYVDTWDGSNNGGRAVARGMYFVRVVGPDIDEIRKIMVVK